MPLTGNKQKPLHSFGSDSLGLIHIRITRLGEKGLDLERALTNHCLKNTFETLHKLQVGLLAVSAPIGDFLAGKLF
jgi:hypothetical protein